MNIEKVLSLDISTKTGWAFATSSDSGIQLVDYGVVTQIHEPSGEYPSNYVMWAYKCYTEIIRLIEKYSPEVLVIEETSKGSKNAMSQKILEWSHFLLAQYITSSKIKCVYLMTEQWRREIGCQMTKEEKKRNKEVREYKKKNKTIVAYDINGKRTGLIGRKHVNIRRVSEIFEGQLKEPLKRKDEDLADGLGLLSCYHFRRMKGPARGEEIDMADLFEGKV